MREIYLGDIIISFNYMSKPENFNMADFKKNVAKIFIHGFLHLLDYDHIKKKDYIKMLNQEQKFLDLFRNFSIKLKKKIVINIFFSLIIGALSSLSLPPLNFFLINFFTFSIFFIFLFNNLSRSNKKLFFFYGWLFGFGYFFTNIYWITISLTFDQNFNFLVPIALILIPAF